MRNLFREEKGSVIILLVLIIAVFAGVTAIVSQSGLVYLTRSKLQNAVDAAALAGAQDIAKGQMLATAQATAIAYVGKNVAVVTTPEVKQYPASGTVTGITVKATKDVPYTLPQIFGVGSGMNTVDATATANTEVITGMSGLVPVVALKGEVQIASGSDILLKGGSQGKFASTGPSGFRGLLSLDNMHGGNLGPLFVTGCQETITVGEGGMIDTENGTISSIINNVNERIAKNPIVYMPVVDTAIINGVETVLVSGGEVKVIGFAAFMLTGMNAGTGTDAQLYGHFVQMIATADSSSTDTTSYYGLKMVKIIQ